MPLDFPASPTLNQTYLNWIFDGIRWVAAQDPRAPFVSRAGDTMAGALEVMFGTPPGDADATSKKYVDDAIASGMLYQGTWVALTNVPDLTGTAHQNGWAWVVITSDPHVNEATGVAIPGLPAGTMVGNGDRIVWNAGTSQFELIHSPGMTQTEADDRYLQLAGGTMNAVTGVAGGGTGITVANSSATATDTAITLTNSGAGHSLSLTNSGAGDGMVLANSGATSSAISLNNTGGYGVWLDNTAAGRGIVLRNLGGGMGMHINQTTAGLTSIVNSGFTFMSTGAAAGTAFAAWRNQTDTTARWWVLGDGSQFIRYDGAGAAFSISTAAGVAPPATFSIAPNGATQVGTPTGTAVTTQGSINVQDNFYLNGVSRAQYGATTGTAVTAAGTVNVSSNYFINGEAVPTAARLNALGIVRGRGGASTYQGTAGDQFREIAQITVNSTAGNQMGTVALPISSVHGNGASYRFIRCPVFAMGFSAAPNLTYVGDLYERTSGSIYGRLWIQQDATQTNMWHVAVSLGQYVDITVGTMSLLSSQNMPAPTATYNYSTVTGADLTANWIACDNLDITDVIGRAYFAEQAVNAAGIGTTITGGVGVPEVGAGWTPTTGTATTTFTHATGSVAPIAYPMLIEAGKVYAFNFTSTTTNNWGTTQTQFFLRNGATTTTGQQTIRTTNLGGSTIIFRATADFTHFVAVPRTEWAGTFAAGQMNVSSGVENSQTLRLKNWTTVIRGDNSRYDGGGGLLCTAANNTAFGWQAMLDTASGNSNTAFGMQALCNLTNGNNNTAVGYWALTLNPTGNRNTALGNVALRDNTIASDSTAVGHASLAFNNATGNTAVGSESLSNNSLGTYNTGFGQRAAFALTLGNNNTAIGRSALENLSTGNENVAVGYFAGSSAGTGDISLTNSAISIFIGAFSRASGNNPSNQIVIGYNSGTSANNTVSIGNNDISLIRVANGNITALSGPSDARVKEAIEPADLGRCLEAVRSLPVSRWRWADWVGARHDRNVTGFAADDVEKVFPKAVTVADERFAGADGDRTVKDCKTITMTEALPTLWGAVQRLIEKNEALEREVAELRKN